MVAAGDVVAPSQRAQAALVVTLITLVGACLGIFMPAFVPDMAQPWATLSAILGAHSQPLLRVPLHHL